MLFLVYVNNLPNPSRILDLIMFPDDINLPVSLPSHECKYAEDFTLQHLSLLEICASEICEMFIHKHSEIMAYVINYPFL